MDKPSGVVGKDGIDAELVRSGVDAELVGTQGAGDGSVLGKFSLKLVQVANIVTPFSKRPT